jgi:hypothetical protein
MEEHHYNSAIEQLEATLPKKTFRTFLVTSILVLQLADKNKRFSRATIEVTKQGIKVDIQMRAKVRRGHEVR